MTASRIPLPAKTAVKPSEKPSDTLATAFDARRRFPIVQAGSQGNNRARILRAGGSGVKDPFLDLPVSGEEDQPVAVPEAPPQRVRRQTDLRYLPPDDTEEESGSGRSGFHPPPLPIERTETDELQERRAEIQERTPRLPIIEPTHEDPTKLNPGAQKSTAPRTSANSPSRMNSLRRSLWATPITSKRNKTSQRAIQDLPPDPQAVSSGERISRPTLPRSTTTTARPRTPRANLSGKRPAERETLENGEELRELDPEFALLPRLGETPADAPPVEMLPPPPRSDRESLVFENSRDRNRETTREEVREPASSEDGAGPQMAESFSQAAAAHPLPSSSAFANGGRHTPWPQSRGVPAKLAGRQLARKDRQNGAGGYAQSLPPRQRPSWPIIRPGSRSTPSIAETERQPRIDKTVLNRRNPGISMNTAADSESEVVSGMPQQESPFAPRSLPTAQGSSPVRLDGIIIEDDEQPVATVTNTNRQILMPPDISDSSPTHVPPPPLSLVPPPLLEPTAPVPSSDRLPAAQQGRTLRSKVAAAPAVPRSSNPDMSFPIDEGADTDTPDLPSSSLMGRTSLIGLCVGIAGLMGLLLWRYLDRRSHRRRRIQLSIGNMTGRETSIATDAESKSAEPAAQAGAPRLHRAA